MIIETLVTPLAKALVLGNSTNAAFAGVQVQPQAPDTPVLDTNGNQVKPDGFLDNNPPGVAGFNRLFVMPYCNSPLATFSVRLYGWNNLGNDPSILCWVPTFLVEILCTSCAIAGRNTPTGVNLAQGIPLLADTEYLCDTLALTAGGLLHAGLGMYGDIVSQAGSNVPAHFSVDVRGSQKISFDFAQAGAGGAGDPVSMNALWCKL